MNAEWMLASTLVAALLYWVAVALQRVAALYGNVAIRWIWVAAIVGAAALPISWLASSHSITRGSAEINQRDLSISAFAPASVARLAAQPARTWWTSVGGWAFSIPHLPQRADRPLLLVWWGLSALLMTVSLATAARLSRQRRRWQSGSIAGQSVFVSSDLGPAVVGVLDPRIVVPAWLLRLDEREQQLIVRHEAEHVAAHDPALVLSTLGLLILAPWNLGLWMQWRGLRRAIEIDCDARVLRHGVERTEYASVLLRASAYGHGGRLASMAFAERVTSLSTRIEHLLRPTPRRRAMKTTLGALAAIVLVALVSAMRAPRQGRTTEAPTPLPESISAVRRADPATPRAEMNDRIFRQLFVGIALDRANEQRAREAIASEQSAQARLRGPVLAIWPRRIALNEVRNVRLRALVAGQDSVTLDARLAERAYRQITTEDVVRNMFTSYLSGVTLSPEDRGKAEHLIRTFVANDLAVFERRGDDSMSANLREVLEEDLRAYVRSAADQARYDQRLAAIHARDRAPRAVVHLTSVSLTRTMHAGDSLVSPVLVYTTGGARVGIGGEEPVALTETLRLYRLPAITADVTDGEVHLEVTDRGEIEVSGAVTGGPARRLTATGRHIVLLRGGIGIRTTP